MSRGADDAEGASAPELGIGLLRDILSFRLRRIRNRLGDSFRQGTVRDGMRPGAFTTLALIEANPGISQIDLARESAFDQASLVGVMDDLERRGWARRCKHPEDRRRHSIEITDDGRRALAALHARAIENEREAREALTEEELAGLLVALDKVYRRLAPQAKS